MRFPPGPRELTPPAVTREFLAHKGNTQLDQKVLSEGEGEVKSGKFRVFGYDS